MTELQTTTLAYWLVLGAIIGMGAYIVVRALVDIFNKKRGDK